MKNKNIRLAALDGLRGIAILLVILNHIPLKIWYESTPMDVDQYPKAEKLFLIAPIDRSLETEKVWEVTSLGKFKINQKIEISRDIILYELEKIKN